MLVAGQNSSSSVESIKYCTVPSGGGSMEGAKCNVEEEETLYGSNNERSDDA